MFVMCSCPLLRYFCVVGGGNDLGWDELETERGQYVLAHNGWVMDADPLVNFAAEGTKVIYYYFFFLFIFFFYLFIYFFFCGSGPTKLFSLYYGIYSIRSTSSGS